MPNHVYPCAKKAEIFSDLFVTVVVDMPIALSFVNEIAIGNSISSYHRFQQSYFLRPFNRVFENY